MSLIPLLERLACSLESSATRPTRGNLDDAVFASLHTAFTTNRTVKPTAEFLTDLRWCMTNPQRADFSFTVATLHSSAANPEIMFTPLLRALKTCLPDTQPVAQLRRRELVPDQHHPRVQYYKADKQFIIWGGKREPDYIIHGYETYDSTHDRGSNAVFSVCKLWNPHAQLIWSLIIEEAQRDAEVNGARIETLDMFFSFKMLAGISTTTVPQIIRQRIPFHNSLTALQNFRVDGPFWRTVFGEPLPDFMTVQQGAQLAPYVRDHIPDHERKLRKWSMADGDILWIFQVTLPANENSESFWYLAKTTDAGRFVPPPHLTTGIYYTRYQPLFGRESDTDPRVLYIPDQFQDQYTTNERQSTYTPPPRPPAATDRVTRRKTQR
jgi:hypothetical protein